MILLLSGFAFWLQDEENNFSLAPVGNKDQIMCIQVITPAKNPKTGEIKEFSTPCDVPSGWEVISQNSIQDETAEWKTYRNEDYGVEFKYPSDWFGPRQEVVDLGGPIIFQSADPINNAHGIGLPSVGNMWVEVSKGCNAKIISDDFVAESYPDTFDKNVCVGSYHIYLGLWQADPNLEQNKNILNQILSTFKFIDKTDLELPLNVFSNTVFKDWLLLAGRAGPDLTSDMFIFESQVNIREKRVWELNPQFNCDEEGFKSFTSPDRRKIGCIASGLEADSDLFVIDKDKGKQTYYASCGTPCGYNDGFWLDNSSFVFLWTFNDYEYENQMKPYHEFKVYIYDLSRGIKKSWTTKHLYN